MIVKAFPLIRPGVFASKFKEIEFDSDSILVKPTLLSICAADQRYYFGLRPSAVIQKKLPMVLIHEAIGQVVSSKVEDFEIGDTVILLPCGINASIDSNYQENAYFRSSNADGFCQELVKLDPSEVIKVSSCDSDDYVFSELLSVCFQALRQVASDLDRANNIGVWGDGSLGFLMSYVIKSICPTKFVTSIGKHEDKLEKFSFSDSTETIFERTTKKYDLLIECVGGNGAQNAINEMIDSANPKATLLLTGVSEVPPPINTRKILEKGLVLKGSTRSVRQDFIEANNFLSNESHRKVVRQLNSQRVIVRNESDLKEAFELSKLSKFKTIIQFAP